VFGIQQDFDDIIITPIEFTRDLLDEPNQVSSIEIIYKKGTDVDAVEATYRRKDRERFYGEKPQGAKHRAL
jgi:lipoprotein-releasing system permease protein